MGIEQAYRLSPLSKIIALEESDVRNKAPSSENGLRVPLAVVASSAAFGGGEKYLIELHTHPEIARSFSPWLFGGIPRWPLGSTSVGGSPKWSYRNAVRSVVQMAGDLRAGRTALEKAHRLEALGLVHMQYKKEQVLLSRSASQIAPTVWTEHGRFPMGMLQAPLRTGYCRAARYVAAIVCVAPHVADEVATLLGPRCPRIVVIENGIDPRWTSPALPPARDQARRSLGIPDACGPVVVFVGRLDPNKRAHLAIEALPFLPDWHLVICGDGGEALSLRKQASDNPSVHFTGFLDDTRPVFAAADVVVLPSANEGLPITLLEGACAGVPAAVIRGSGLERAVEGWGAVADVATGEAVADAIKRAAALPSESCRHWAVSRSTDVWASAHADLFRSLVD